MHRSNQDVVAIKQDSNFSKWMKRGQWQKPLVIVTFMFIPLLLLLVFTYLPFAKMVQFSFYDMKYLGDREFVGIDNYIQVFKREDCFKALYLSLYYMAGAIIQLCLALYFASILSFKTKGGTFFKGAMFFPYLICGIAVGFIFKFFYTRGFVLDTILSWIGFNPEDLPYWLKDKRVNNFSLVFSSVWRYMGQNIVLFIGAMMSVDQEMFEAADLDGANKWQRFRYIIFPNIKSVFVLNMILAISGSLSAFEPPFVITKGSMGTATYFYVMHKVAHDLYKVGLASAMAVVLLGIIVIITILQKVIMNRLFNDGDADESRNAKKNRKKEEKKKQLELKRMGA